MDRQFFKWIIFFIKFFLEILNKDGQFFELMTSDSPRIKFDFKLINKSLQTKPSLTIYYTFITTEKERKNARNAMREAHFKRSFPVDNSKLNSYNPDLN